MSEVINRVINRLYAKDDCESGYSPVLFTPLQFTTEASSFSECYRLSSLPLCRFHISRNFPIAHFRPSSSNRFIPVFSSPFSRDVSNDAYLRLCSSKVTRKNAPRRQLVWAHRDEITSYASRSRRCNAIATTQVQRYQHSPSSSSFVSSRYSTFTAPCIARFSSSDRLFNIDRIVATDVSRLILNAVKHSFSR